MRRVNVLEILVENIVLHAKKIGMGKIAIHFVTHIPHAMVMVPVTTQEQNAPVI